MFFRPRPSHKKIRNPYVQQKSSLICRRRLDQLQYRYASDDDQATVDIPFFHSASPEVANDIPSEQEAFSLDKFLVNQRSIPEEYTRQNPKESIRRRKQPETMFHNLCQSQLVCLIRVAHLVC